MRKTLIASVLALFATPALAQTVYVKPHVRSDGTYVPGHFRSSPNSSRYDNWSTQPNINPYTGEKGTEPVYPTYPRVQPYRAPDPRSPLPPNTQYRWQQQFPMTCKYSDLC